MIDASAMRMLSGYVSLTYDSCVGAATVSSCFAAASNSTHTASEDGRFYYNGGHFQKYAVDLGLGNDDNGALAMHIKSLVGAELAFTYSSPQLAGGVKTTAADYAAFLRKILAGGLAIHDHLGENAVCTQPSTCSAADYSPAPAAWHYSYAHWVEDDPQTGDGAFSSPGAFGFYPWIDASKTYYGIVARYALTSGAYIESAKCGAALRKAFITGTPQ
jgi:CubicO group peptidase (beta-lactamase class C family)